MAFAMVGAWLSQWLVMVVARAWVRMVSVSQGLWSVVMCPASCSLWVVMWMAMWGHFSSRVRSSTVVMTHWSAGLVVPRRLAITNPMSVPSLVASMWASLTH